MTATCPNCGTALLDSDTTCYRCSAALPGNESDRLTQGDHTVNLKAAAAYVGVVVSLMILGALAANWLGAGVSGQPEAAPVPTVPPGWSEYTSPQGDYRIWLPDRWRLYTNASAEWEDLVDRLRHPVPDGFEHSSPQEREKRLGVIGHAESGDNGQLISLSIEVYPTLADTALESLQEAAWWVAGQRLDTSAGLYIAGRESGDRVLIADLIYPGDSDEYEQAMMNVYVTNRGAYAITVSGTADEFWTMEERLWEILDSFRLLDGNRP